MEYSQQIILKNGKVAVLRNGVESDGSAVLENFNLTHGETDYLLSYPDENSFDPEQEGQFLKQKTESVNEIEIVAFVDAGFDILDAQECFRPIKFFDIGALVWFARIIEWEFPGFSVDCYKDSLLRAQKLLEENGVIEGSIPRFLLVCKKRGRV